MQKILKVLFIFVRIEYLIPKLSNYVHLKSNEQFLEMGVWKFVFMQNLTFLGSFGSVEKNTLERQGLKLKPYLNMKYGITDYPPYGYPGGDRFSLGSMVEGTIRGQVMWTGFSDDKENPKPMIGIETVSVSRSLKLCPKVKYSHEALC